ncbi:hypothetical protein C7E25_24625, partial [Stenotrophomonas maltophilia]
NLRPADASGRQGRNWALAPMLPEGTTSWDVLAVKLADGKPVNLRPADASGRQGRNWALAPMLPEGTTSWDVLAV